jgi:SAM-dependent methyltransferase
LFELETYQKRVDFFLKNSTVAQRRSGGVQRLLIVGVGEGEEALCLQKSKIASDVLAIDIQIPTWKEAVENFLLADACSLPFRKETFDYCYCYHALEHIENYERAIGESARVLKEEGELYLSTPNKTRIVLYVQIAGRRRPMKRIIRRNLLEWLARLTGRFTADDYHVGFTYGELHCVLAANFKDVNFVTDKYALHIAEGTRFVPIVKLLHLIRALRAIAPSHTVYCERPILSGMTTTSLGSHDA